MALSKPVLSLASDTGAVGTDRQTSQGIIDVGGLALGNAAVDVSKLTSANTTINLSKELAQENETLTAAPGALIAYGKKGFSGWAFRTVPASGKLGINNSTFGDPLGGVYKAAYLASSSLAPAGNSVNNWQYSLDFGNSWSAPIAVGLSNKFQVPDGNYAEGQVRVRQTLVTPPVARAGDNLIQNGSSEQGWTGTGWTPIQSIPAWTAADQFEVWGTGMTNPSDGRYLLELDYNREVDSISQAITTQNGTSYLLQFDLKSRGGGNETVEVYWRNALVGTASTRSTSWETFSFTVTGSGGSDLLTLREPANENNTLGVLLDNFRLTSTTFSGEVVTQSEVDTTFAAFSVDTGAPTISLKTPGGVDQVVSRNMDDRLITGKAEVGHTVNLLTNFVQSEDFNSGVAPSWLKFDIPNSSIASIQLDRSNGELDFSARGGRTNLWDNRDNAPFAWVARPSVNQNETWFIEAKVRIDSRSQGETIAGITFSNPRDGGFEYGAPSFYVDSWHKPGTNVTLQGLGNNNPFTTADNSTLVAGESASAYLRVEITEKGVSDEYQFYYRKSATDTWSKLGSKYNYSVDNSRAALFYKTGNAKAGLAAFDDLKVGKLSDTLLASDIAVSSDGAFSYQLSDAELKSLGEGSDKTLIAVQTDLAGNTGRSETARFAVDTEQIPVRILSVGGGDGKVSSEQVEIGQGPLLLQLDQYTGYWSSELSKLRSYVASFSPTSVNKKYSVLTDIIDFTDDQGGFAGELPYDKRWPAAEALNVWGTQGINNQFFVKVSGDFHVGEAGKYRFRTYNDDGVFLTINNSLIINDPTLHPERVFTGDIDLSVGNHQLELFFFENGGEASLEFSVSRFDQKSNKWGAYQLVGKDPSFKARSVVEVDNKITGTGEPNRLVSIWLGEVLLGTTTVDAAGGFIYAMSPANLALLAAASADVRIRATQTDSSGNVSQTEPVAIELSEKTPLVNILGIGGSDKLVSTAVSDGLVEISGEPELTTKLLLGNQVLKEIVSDKSGKSVFSLEQKELALIGQGAGKSLVVQQEQPSGTKGSSSPFEFAVDTVAPQVSLTSVGSGNGRVSRIRPLISGTGEGNGKVILKLNGEEIGQVTPSATGQFSYTLTENNLVLIENETSSNSSPLLTAVQADAAGNIGTSAEIVIAAKLTPPPLNITEIGGLDRVISSQVGDGSIKGTGAEPGLSVSVLYNGNLLGESTPADSDGKFSYILSYADLQIIGQGGPLQLTLRQEDEYGNIGTVVTPEFRIDTVAPILVSPQRGDLQALGRLDGVVSTQVGDSTLNGTGEANRDLLIIHNNTNLATVRTASDGKFSYTLTTPDITAIGQGTAKQLQLQQSDAAGNTSSWSVDFDVDTIAPSPPQISNIASDAIVSSNSSDNVISGTAEPGSIVTLAISGRPLATVTASSRGIFSYQLSNADIAGLGQRSLQVTAQIEDKAGNVARSQPFSFHIDTLAPEAPTIMFVGGDDNIVSTKGSRPVTATVDDRVEGTAEAGSAVSIFRGTSLLGTTTANSTGVFNYRLTATNLASYGQGTSKSLTAVATDVAGNASKVSSAKAFSIDTVAPGSPKVSSLGGQDGVMTLLPGDNQIIGISEANTTVELLVLNGSSSVFAVPPIKADSKGAWSYAFTSQQLNTLANVLQAGSSPTVQAVVTDNAGNAGASVSIAVNVDIKTPTITLSKVGGSDGIVSTISGDNIIAGIADANSTINLSSNGKALGTLKTDSQGRFTYNLTSQNIATLGQGLGRQVDVSQASRAGNVGRSLASFGIDTVAPSTVTISSIGGTDKIVTALSGDHVVTGRAESGTRLEVVAISGSNSTTLGSAEVSKDNTFSYALTAENLQLVNQGVGKRLMVSSYDLAGNRTDSIPFTFAVQAVWKTGTGAADVLSFASGVDVLTGRAGADRFLLPSLGTALVSSGQTPAFDRITDFQVGLDQIDAPNPVSAGQVRDLGQILALSTTQLTQLLSRTAFPASGAAVFRHRDPQNGERTFLALNDSKVGFDTMNDAIIEITGFSGSLTALQVI